MAYTTAPRLARSMALRARATKGPRPAPATQSTLEATNQVLEKGLLDNKRHTLQCLWASP
jgi:hypothetical protein